MKNGSGNLFSKRSILCLRDLLCPQRAHGVFSGGDSGRDQPGNECQQHADRDENDRCLEGQKRDIALRIDAEEMAELYVNDRFCGVSFWSPHRFEIPQALTGGKTALLRLIVTGSLCNRYGIPVPYGLRETE